MSPEERQELIADIAIALKQAMDNELTDEERQWVRLVIEAEARKIKFRDAVIEKTLEKIPFIEKPTLEQYYESDGEARSLAASIMKI